MKTESPKNMFSKRKQDGDTKDDSICYKNGLLPPAVVHVSREEIKKFLRGKRVGNYLLGKTVGSGSFARVKQGLHILTGEKVAVKIIDKKLAQEDPYVAKNMRREARLLQMVRHPNVIKLLEVVETEHRYYLVTEVAQGGDLMDYICYRKRLGEREVRKFTWQIVSAVHYLHQAGIIHRDLKIENLLMDEEFNIKIIDFGLSNILHRHQSDKRSRMEHCQTQCGSPAYAAPEILGHKPYGLEADVWSIGVNMFAMLTGKLPFTAEPFHITTLYNKMKNNEISPLPETVSSACKEIVSRFLTFDPKKRITLDEAMEHEWMKKGSEEPFLPVRFPGYLKEQHLNQDIITHMVDKMDLKRANVVGMLSQNRATPETTIYHLLKTRLDRFLQGQPKKRTHHDELLPIDSLQAKALSASKGSPVTRNKDLEELDTSTKNATSPDVTGPCSPAEDYGMETVVDGTETEESQANDVDGRLDNDGKAKTVDNTPVLKLPDNNTMFKPSENGRKDDTQNVLISEEFRREEGNKNDVVATQDPTVEEKLTSNVARKEDEIVNVLHLPEPNKEGALTHAEDLTSIKTFGEQSSNEVKIVSSFMNTSARSNISHISVSSLRTPSQDHAVQMSITISSAKSLVDSQALIEEKGREEKEGSSSEETNCSLPKRKKSSGRVLAKKHFPSKIPAIGGVSPARAKIISIPLTTEKDKDDKDETSKTRRFTLPSSRVTLPESVRVPGPRQRDKTPLSLSFTTMVERIAAKANREPLDQASTPRHSSHISRENQPIGSADETDTTLKQSSYGTCYQLDNTKATESVNDASSLSRESVRVTVQDFPPMQQLSKPEVVLRPPSPRPPSSHRYTIPVVQGKDLYKIIIGSTVTNIPSTRVRTKAVPKRQSKIPVPISEFSEKETSKEGTGESRNAGRVFKLPLPLPKTKRTSLEHVRDLKTQEPPNLMSNMVLTYRTKSPAIQPLPLSPCDKDPKSPGFSKNNPINETCGRNELVKRRVWRRTSKDQQDEIEDRRRTIHVTDAAYVTPVTQDKRSARSANSERSVNRSTTNSPSLDAMKKRVRVRARPRSWIEPSANPPIITSSKISIMKFTLRRS